MSDSDGDFVEKRTVGSGDPMFKWSVGVIAGKSGDPLVDNGCRKSIVGFTNASNAGDPDGSNNSRKFLNPASSKLMVEERSGRPLK